MIELLDFKVSMENYLDNGDRKEFRYGESIIKDMMRGGNLFGLQECYKILVEMSKERKGKVPQEVKNYMYALSIYKGKGNLN